MNLKRTKIICTIGPVTQSYSILSEPDRASNSFAFAPKAIINTLDLEKTNVVQPGSRVRFSTVYLGEKEELLLAKSILEKTKQPGDNIREAKDSNDSLGKAIERSGNFFLLGGLLAVLMAAFTVGMSSQRFARRHVKYVAILKSLGTESWEIKVLYSLIFIELGVFAIFLGLILGWFMQEAFTGILKQYFPTDLPTPGFKPLLISSLTVFICLIGFVYPNLVKLVKISPLNILRREESKASNSSYLMFTLALSAMFLLVFLYTQRLLLSTIVFFTILFIFVLGYGLILSFFRSKTRLGLGAHNSLSLAWSELHRRKYTNSLQVLAFSMAIGLSLIAFSPDFLFIELGANDGLRGYPASKVRSNLIQMCKLVERKEISIILMEIIVAPNYGTKYMQRLARVYKEVADKCDAKLVPPMLNKELVLNKDLMLPDGIHPNANGQYVIAHDLYAWISEL